MDWKDVGAKVLDSAPMIGSLLGGPLGGAAGGLMKMIGGALGLKTNETTPDKVMQVIEQNPEAMLKFKELEMVHKVELEKLLLEQDRMYLQDRQDARKREQEIVRATGQKDVNLYVLAWLFVVGFFTTIIVMTALALTGNLPDEMPQYVVFLLGSLFGTLTGGTGAVIQYFFGSSKGSSDKTTTMADFQRMLVQGRRT